METKFAIQYLTSLIKDFSLIENTVDRKLKYFESRGTYFFLIRQDDGFVFVDSKLEHTLRESYGFDNQESIINLLNIFFKKICINITVRGIYILEFNMFK